MKAWSLETIAEKRDHDRRTQLPPAHPRQWEMLCFLQWLSQEPGGVSPMVEEFCQACATALDECRGTFRFLGCPSECGRPKMLGCRRNHWRPASKLGMTIRPMTRNSVPGSPMIPLAWTIWPGFVGRRASFARSASWLAVGGWPTGGFGASDVGGGGP